MADGIEMGDRGPRITNNHNSNIIRIKRIRGGNKKREEE